MNLRQDARHLKAKSISSMCSAMTAFNSPDADGRVTRVLLHLQHAFEMLLKAALVQDRMQVFDKKTGRSIGFERCLHEARESERIKLTEPESGTLHTIDAMRDDEQHWYTLVEEGLLYLHARAAVTLFDDLLHRAFGERLANHLPLLVLPIGTEPPQDFQTLVDREYENIAELLKPKRQAGAEAAARVRALLTMEAHVEDDAAVSNTDVRRGVKGIRGGKSRAQVFPKLADITATGGPGAVCGDALREEGRSAGPARQGRGPGCRRDPRGRPAEEVPPECNGLSQGGQPNAPEVDSPAPPPRRRRRPVVRSHVTFESQKLTYYSDNAFTRMRDALNSGIDMEAIGASPRHGQEAGAATAMHSDRLPTVGSRVLTARRGQSTPACGRRGRDWRPASTLRTGRGKVAIPHGSPLYVAGTTCTAEGSNRSSTTVQ